MEKVTDYENEPDNDEDQFFDHGDEYEPPEEIGTDNECDELEEEEVSE